MLNRLPLDYFRLPVEPVQIFYLLIAYGLLAIPFFFAGLVICAAYSLLPEKTGIAYFATMTGSACGAVLPALLLPFIKEGRLIVISAVVPLLTIMPLLRPAARSPWSPSAGFRGTSGYLLAAAAVITGTAALLITTAPQTVAVHPSPYKAQSQILQLPDSRITETRDSINGRITIVSSPYIRFAPGLSLTFGGELPHQTAVYRDGDNQLVLLYGDPVVSLTVVLAGMLVFSGVGGFLSQRLSDRALVVSLALLVTLLALAGPVTAWLTRANLPYPVPVNVVLGLEWLAVPGVLTGLPFPLAMRHLLKTPSVRTYAWTANGCASVLASIAATQLALSQGIAAVVIGAAAAYGVALICALKIRSSAGVKNSKEKIEIRP